MNRATVLLVAFACLLPASWLLGASGKPSETLTPSPDVITAQLSRQQAALALIPFSWEQLHYDIVFMAPRRGYRAMTLGNKHRIEVYARPQDDLRLLAYDIAHELGHAFDLTYNNEQTRKEWMRLRGIDPQTKWFGCDRCSDYGTPAGDFAETFALLLCGPDYFRGLIAGRPTSDQVPSLKSFFPKGTFTAF